MSLVEPISQTTQPIEMRVININTWGFGANEGAQWVWNATQLAIFYLLYLLDMLKLETTW